LAGGAFQPLDPTRDLHIGNGDSKTAVGSNATLNPPQPITDHTQPGQLTSGPRAGLPGDNRSPSSIQPVGAASGGSTDAVLELLKARGVTWYRVEPSPDNSGDFKFSCSVPNPSNPNIRRMYEAQGQDQRTAMLAVLAQMDQERR
jgi:hypothetical protein